ncbi:MAG: hypothetical protein ACRDIY_24295 [Chloroflexota bacterium]
MIDTRQELHQLVNMLPKDQLADAQRALREIAERSPLLRSLLNAPIDDEPLTPEEVAAIEEGWEDIRAGRVISDDELCRQLGLPPHQRP